MKLEEYLQLPDLISCKELYKLFKLNIRDYSQRKISKLEFLTIISELTDRQIRTYELLEMDLRSTLDDIMCDIWNVDSYSEVDLMLSIIVNLGLVRSFKKVEDSIVQNANISSEIKSEIESTIEEVGENISNPYYNLEISNH